MRPIPRATTQILASESYRQAFLFKINVAELYYYYTTWDNRLLYAGSLYLPRGMNPDKITSGSGVIVGNMNISIDDIDKALYSSLYGEQTQDHPVTLLLALLDEFSTIIDAIVVFDGFVSEWAYSGGIIDLRLSSIFSKWARVTTTKFSPSCRWRIFGGPECKYSKSPLDECDRTFKTCSEIFNNSVNFGGYRWLPDVKSKKFSFK